ncbi:MAG: Crp/Fnr family transcriptional regulator [Deltaproteobacteria bacterium]|nr:MAG: Crp/Fnr family transcriptional regulator [Deltaproteobacteria bacterium]
MMERTLIRNVNIFSDLKDREVDKILEIVEKKDFIKDSTILTQDDLGDALFIIVSGRVKVVLMGEEGKEITLSTLKEGAFFGEMSLLDGEPRSASVVALEDSSLLIMKRDEFLNQIRKSPGIALKIMIEMSKRLRRADEKIGSLALLDVYGRIAQVLIQLAKSEEGGTKKAIIIKKRPTHQEIANMVGTSRETVSRVLSDLSKEGYITIKGKEILIHKDLSPVESLGHHF